MLWQWACLCLLCCDGGPLVSSGALTLSNDGGPPFLSLADVMLSGLYCQYCTGLCDTSRSFPLSLSLQLQPAKAFFKQGVGVLRTRTPNRLLLQCVIGHQLVRVHSLPSNWTTARRCLEIARNIMQANLI